MIEAILWIANFAIFGYFLAINTTYAVLLVFAARVLGEYLRSEPLAALEEVFRSPFTPGVTILVPAYNEGPNIVTSVTSMLALRYPQLQVVVVNDGSKDDTLDRMVEHFQMVPAARVDPRHVDTQEVRGVFRSRVARNLLLIDKANGGKADALNCALNFADEPLVCAVDADAMLEPDALLRVVKPFLDDPANMIAVGGIIRIANGCTIEDGQVTAVALSKNHIARFQVVEYLRAFLIGRTGWNVVNALLIISGAFGVFRRDAVLAVGGYDHKTVGEDAELVVRMHRHFRESGRPYAIEFVPDPVCWTEAPETRRVLARQRRRWQRGLLQTLSKHRRMAFNPRYGPAGTIAWPYQFVFEALGPVVELVGYVAFVLSVALGLMNWPFAILFFLVAFLYGVILSTSSILLEEFSFRRYRSWRDVLTLVAYAILENFGYRQLHTWWRFLGMVDLFRSNVSWGDMERRGLGQQPAMAVAPTDREAARRAGGASSS